MAVANGLENGKGRGLAVTRPVAALDVLIVAQAFAVAPVQEICSKVLQLLTDPSVCPRKKAQFLALSSGDGELTPVDIGWFCDGPFAAPPEVDASRVRRILEVNTQDMSCAAAAAGLEASAGSITEPRREEDQCGVWLLPSLLNHSCAPNTSFVLLGRDTVCVFAARDLEAGTEVTDSYADLFCPRRARQEELLRQKGFVCACCRCEAEARLPPAEVDRILDRQVKADHLLSLGGPEGIGRWLEVADLVQEAAAALTAAAKEGGGEAPMLRAALLPADISVARTLQCFTSAHPELGTLGGRAARACLQAASLIEALAPWSVHHISFLWMGLQMWLRAGASDSPPARATAFALAVAWCGRHGASLGWPGNLPELCLEAFGRRDTSGAAAGVLRAALDRLVALSLASGPPKAGRSSQQLLRQIRGAATLAAAAAPAAPSPPAHSAVALEGQEGNQTGPDSPNVT